MFVLCPHCQFLVALETATGQPPEECPRCRERLQPLMGASQAAPSAEPAGTTEPLLATTGDPAPDDKAVVADITLDTPEHPEDVPPVRSDMADVAPADITDATVDTAPNGEVAQAPIAAAAPPPPVQRPSRWSSTSTRRRMAMASVPLLAIALLLQSLLADRARLAADARWRPLVAMLCDVLPCTLPPWHEPAAFTLLDRDVRPDPHRSGVLHVSAGFRNDARWSQPWPSLLLTLSDADGRIAGARVFRPDEYLGSKRTRNGIASGQSAQVSFDVVEPTRDVVAFTFDFR